VRFLWASYPLRSHRHQHGEEAVQVGQRGISRNSQHGKQNQQGLNAAGAVAASAAAAETTPTVATSNTIANKTQINRFMSIPPILR